jgi:hypothetical protein
MPDAANDVYSGLELYNHFIQLAERNELTLKPETFTWDVSLSGDVVIAKAEESSDSSDSPISAQTSPIDENTVSSQPMRPVSQSQPKRPLIVKRKRTAPILLKSQDVIDISDSDSDSEQTELLKLAASMRLDDISSKSNNRISQPVNKNPFGSSPFSDASFALSTTMSYALGLKK